MSMTCLNALHRRSIYLLLALCTALPWMQGCGGMDQKDIRKYALKRKSDDDDAPACTSRLQRRVPRPLLRPVPCPRHEPPRHPVRLR